MSERIEEQDDFWEIDRVTPIVNLELPSGEVRRATYVNAELYKFPGAWAMANHIYLKEQPDADPPVRSLHIFNSDETMQSLEAKGFPVRIEPWPCDSDILAFRTYQNKKLEQELGEL